MGVMIPGRRIVLYGVALGAAIVAHVELGRLESPSPPVAARPATAPGPGGPGPASRAASRAAARPRPPRPPAGHALRPDELDRSVALVGLPRLRRWQPLVRRVVGPHPDDFALLMTLIVVESGGRQFAVSRTGCIGLMQFCARTALRPPFDRIYDIERLRPCRCGGRCRVGWDVRRFLEITPRPLHPIVAADFPCSLTDPRFDPAQAIRAGWAYVKQLSADFAGNIYLVYIGYNSGPHVAQRIWAKLGARRAERLGAIGRVLRRALAPNFGRRARRRARALVRVHLPKLARVYRLYQEAEAVATSRVPTYRPAADVCAARPPRRACVSRR